jgi:2-methylfumaryl-CoA hydratase
MTTDRIEIAGPYFEELRTGQQFSSPGVTLTTAHAAIYQAIFGDRLMLPLDQPASSLVTGSAAPLAHPLLVINFAIGQSTWVSQRVKANLFYRGLCLLQQAYIGDTLRTVTRVVALRRNQPKSGRGDTGMVGLEIMTHNQRGENILHFWRCPMIPCRDQAIGGAPVDDFDQLGLTVSNAPIPPWDFGKTPLSFLGDRYHSTVKTGTVLSVEARDTVTSAPEFARLTLNMAMAHTDVRHSHLGARLVYGGHTISTCFAQLSRALPRLITLLSWDRCDHVAPVIEGDCLRSEFTVLESTKHQTAEALTLRAHCFAMRGAPESETLVLDWIFTVLIACDSLVSPPPVASVNN